MNNPISYTSRTFQTILADINSDPELSDKPEWIKRLVAGVGDVVSMVANAEANNCKLRTALTREAVMDICYQMGYELPEATTSSGTVLFMFKHDAAFPITASRGDLAATTRGSLASSAVRFEASDSQVFDTEQVAVNLTTDPISENTITVSRDFLTGEKLKASCSGTMPTGFSDSSDYYAIRVDATHIKVASTLSGAFAGTALIVSGGSGTLTLTMLSGRVTCRQQEYSDGVVIGTSDGYTGWQEFDLPDSGVLRDTLSVTVNGEAYVRVPSLATSKSYDRHYQHIYRSDGSSFLRFGDGSYGTIPPNFDVVVSYATGGGSDSNVSALNSVSVYAGGSQDIVGCANATAITGGTNAQAIEVAKRVAPGALLSHSRFITAEDGESLALAYGGISTVRVIPNAYGVLSCKVVAVAVGGGNPTPTYRAGLQSYLIEKTILETTDVRVMEATITAHSIITSFKPKPGYSYAGVLPYYRFAWKLLLTECGQEIVDDYLSNGIASAVDLCNDLLTESMGPADYPKVQAIILALDSLGARSFGDSVEASDAYSFIQANVDGIDFMAIASPAFPLTHAADEISSVGTITISEAS